MTDPTTSLNNLSAASVLMNSTQIIEGDAHYTHIRIEGGIRGFVFLSYGPKAGWGAARWLREQLLLKGYVVSSEDDGPHWQAAISRADWLIVLLTADAARTDSAVTAHIRCAKKLHKPHIILRMQAGYTPVDLLLEPYIQGQPNREAAFAALLRELAGQPRLGSWLTPGEHIGQTPEKFLGRQELQHTFDDLISRVQRDGRSYHLITGGRVHGKTALLHRIGHLAAAQDAVVLSADLNPLGLADPERLPFDEAVSQFWAQIIRQHPATAGQLTEFNDVGGAMTWLRDLLTKLSQTRPVVILIDNLHQDSPQADKQGPLTQYLASLTGHIIVIATTLTDGLTPPPAFPPHLRVRTHNVGLFVPREIGLMFKPLDMETGREICDLSGGHIETTRDLIGLWDAAGCLAWRDDHLVRLTDIDLPDLWMNRIEMRVEEALDALPLPDGTDYDDVMDVLTCAAVQGAVLSEQIIFGAMGEELPAEHITALLEFLAAAPLPILVPAVPDLPFADHRWWRFTPVGVREFLLHDANESDVVRYGEAVLAALITAAHPDLWPLRYRLSDLAQQTLDFLIAHLRLNDTPQENIATHLQASPAFVLWQQFRGGIEREQRLADLHFMLQLAKTPQERYPLLKQLVLTMKDYERNADTAAMCARARTAGHRARMEGHELAHLFYIEALVSKDTSQKALRLLQSGWCRLPQPVCQEDKLSPFLDMRRDPQHPHYETLKRVLSRQVMARMAALLDAWGQIYQHVGEQQQALVYYEAALPLSRAAGDQGGEVATLCNMGFSWSDLGEKRKALDLYEQTLPLSRALGDRYLEASTLQNIGHIQSDLGETAKALVLFEAGLGLMRAIGDRAGEAMTLESIGRVCFDLGQTAKALAYYEVALRSLQAVGDRGGQAVTLHRMGRVWHDLGDMQKAITYVEQAIATTFPEDPKLTICRRDLASWQAKASAALPTHDASDVPAIPEPPFHAMIEAPLSFAQGETAMSDEKKPDIHAENLQGGNIVIGSTQSVKGNITIKMGDLTQIIQGSPAAATDKEALQKLVDDLRAELAAKTINDADKAAVKTVITRTEELVREASAEDVDTGSVKSKAERLQQAADNILKVLPTVALIAGGIVAQGLKMAGVIL